MTGSRSGGRGWRRAARAGIAALALSGCASWNPLSDEEGSDPMRAELRRLEREQRRVAAEEQRIEAAEREAREEHPPTMEEKLRHGDAQLAAGNLPAALWDYAFAHQLEPGAAAPRERLGYVHLRSDPSRAQPLFESALAIEPDSVSAHIGLGLSLLASGDREGGVRHLERAVELAPKSAKAHAALGVTLDQLGRREEALSHLETARALRPNDARILNNLGVAYLRAGKPDRAEPLLRAALRQDTHDAVLRSNNLGMALALQGRFAEALDWFRRGGDEQSARANLGYAYHVRGEYSEAIAEYERALLVGGKSNVEVVRNLRAARDALEGAPAGSEPEGPVATAPPPPGTATVDPAAIADDDGPPAGAGEPRRPPPASDAAH